MSRPELVRSLLALSRARNEPTRLNLTELVPATIRLTRRALPLNVVTELDLPEEPVTVFADPVGMQQVLVNLVLNARDAMPDGGLIRVHLGVEQNDAVLAVEDTGVGIPEELRSRVFDRFFTTKPPGQGTGLGLALVFDITRQNRGKVTLDSTMGVGTTFTVRLPLYAPQPVQEPASMTASR